jgi:hypothetical protein
LPAFILLSGTLSGGVIMKNDLTGQKFNRLIAIKATEKRSNKGEVIWLFKCDCGNFKEAKGVEVKRGRLKSCGCLKNETNKEQVICKHCGKEFLKHQCYLNENNYCSRLCYQKSLKTNEYNTKGDITEIIIKSKHGTYKCLIDTKNLNILKNYSWSIEGKPESKGRKSYISANPRNKKMIKIHRLITNCPEGLEVDHIDGNPLNNLEANLRICTGKENKQNINKTNTKAKSKVRNVHWLKRDNKWRVTFVIEGKNKNFGYYKNLEEAIEKADQIRKEIKPFYAYGNI